MGLVSFRIISCSGSLVGYLTTFRYDDIMYNVPSATGYLSESVFLFISQKCKTSFRTISHYRDKQRGHRSTLDDSEEKPNTSQGV